MEISFGVLFMSVMDQQAIEKVQHRATKIIPELRHHSYQERLQRLSLPSLVHAQTAKRGNDISIPADTPVL